MRVRALAAVLTLVLTSAACASREWARDYAGTLTSLNRDDIVTTVVIDDRTGLPLPGVSVRLYKEQTILEAPFVTEFRTDEFGVLCVPWEQRYYNCHWVFDHPGYAPKDWYPSPDIEVRLRPGRDVHGTLLDAFGRPAAGVTVEHFVGCIHSATVRRAVTDERGRFTLRDVEPGHDFLWAPQEGAEAEYWLPSLAPVSGLVYEPHRPGPGVTVTGLVVDAAGDPVAGATVRSDQLERGPSAKSGADGHFRVVGVAPKASVLPLRSGLSLRDVERIAPERPSDTADDAKPARRTIRVYPRGRVGVPVLDRGR